MNPSERKLKALAQHALRNPGPEGEIARRKLAQMGLTAEDVMAGRLTPINVGTVVSGNNQRVPKNGAAAPQSATRPTSQPRSSGASQAASGGASARVNNSPPPPPPPPSRPSLASGAASSPTPRRPMLKAGATSAPSSSIRAIEGGASNVGIRELTRGAAAGISDAPRPRGKMGTGIGALAVAAAGVYGIYKGIRGFTDQVGPALIDSAMDVAFDNPQADQDVLGTDLTPSMIYAVGGLPGSNVARALNYGRFGADIGAGGSMAVAGGATAAGALIGGLSGGLKGGIAGAAIGAVTGTALASQNIIGTARTNSRILSESPFYNSSLLTADRLNASGDIVLGMHNSRRG